MKPGRRCLVFGGSGTLGRAVCRALTSEGARVAFTYYKGEQVARELSQELAAAAFHFDARCLDATAKTIDAAAQALDGIDAFVQCIGAPMPVHLKMSAVDETLWN